MVNSTPRIAVASAAVALVVLASLLDSRQAHAVRTHGIGHTGPWLAGRVVETEARWVPGPRAGIETVFALETASPFPSLEVLHVAGGALDGLVLVVEDAPWVVPGCEGRFGVARRLDGDWDVVETGVLVQPPGYSLEEANWSWQAEPVAASFRLQANFPSDVGSEADVLDAYASALNTWAVQGGADVVVDWGGEAAHGSLDYDEALYGFFGDGETTSGSTLAISQWWSDGGSRMLDCDTVFYERNGSGTIRWSADPAGPGSQDVDLESVALHEIGHCLGLDHPAGSQPVMAASITTGTSKRDLHDDDAAGLQAIYGSGCGDNDDDGYPFQEGCGSAVDCDDDAPAVHPGATESCDMMDNDCDGAVDEGFPDDEVGACADGQDNDCDGTTDASDTDCAPADDDTTGDDDDTTGAGDDDDAQADDDDDDDAGSERPRLTACLCDNQAAPQGTAQVLGASVALFGLARRRYHPRPWRPTRVGR